MFNDLHKGIGCLKCPVNEFDCDAQYRGSRCVASRAKAGCHSDPMTNGDRVRAMSVEELAEYGVYGCIPAGCTTPAWFGHFKGFANTKAEAIQREKDWLTQPAQEEG